MKKSLKESHELYLKSKIEPVTMDQRSQSYLGTLSHANQHSLSQALKNAYWVREFSVGNAR